MTWKGIIYVEYVLGHTFDFNAFSNELDLRVAD